MDRVSALPVEVPRSRLVLRLRRDHKFSSRSTRSTNSRTMRSAHSQDPAISSSLFLLWAFRASSAARSETAFARRLPAKHNHLPIGRALTPKYVATGRQPPYKTPVETLAAS